MAKNYNKKVKQIQKQQAAKKAKQAKRAAKIEKRQATKTTIDKPKRVGKPRGHYKVYQTQNSFSLPNQRQHDSLRMQVERFVNLNEDLIRRNQDLATIAKNKLIDTLVNKTRVYRDIYGFKTVKETLEFLVEHTTTVRPQQDIFAENIIKAMKDYGVWQDFLNLNITEDGKELPVINSLFAYKGNGVYVYDNRIVIEIVNNSTGSSYEIRVYRKY